ncbi:MAG: DUF1743 domain-containing protein [Candidatus Thorarchaeota archaeon]|nr:DUF1743 domain-containing protein [Candidatus Thorarchaeota archaeon]
MRKQIHLGIDDIDSPGGGCTTHFAALLVERLSTLGSVWTDYPNLIRLNPNIPFRTRGNGAIALRFILKEQNLIQIKPLLESMIEDYVDLTYPNTNPGAMLIEGKPSARILDFANRALWRTIPIEIGKRLIHEEQCEHISYGNGRGLVGALAAVGNLLNGDYTFEYIAYRKIQNSGKMRGVSNDSVLMMDKAMGDKTFSNIDGKTGLGLIAPHGPDPVLFGIRGEQPQDVIKAASYIKSKQDIDRWMVFRTNQGTGAHLTNCVYIADLRPYMAAVVHGVVDSAPRIIEGGHVIFGVEDCSGRIDCAAYEPTGNFREIILNLIKGDQVLIHVGVRPAAKTHGLTLNVEGIEILKAAEKLKLTNPICPRCAKRMKSAGSGKGYKCFNCGFKDPKGKKITILSRRNIEKRLYLPPPRAQRHLTRPMSRLNQSNEGEQTSLIYQWHSHMTGNDQTESN